MQSAFDKISRLFSNKISREPFRLEKLAEAGSSRVYCRLLYGNSSCIGVKGSDVKENKAFLSITEHLLSHGIRVPRVLAVSDDFSMYILSDLGSTSLLDYVTQVGFDVERITAIYKLVLADLVQIQVVAGADFDFEQCLSRKVFDSRQVYWDLLYFKYYYLKIIDLPYDEQRLDDEFLGFANYIGDSKESFFMYRDLQSRNIMVKDGLPHYIDYQGGMRGPLQYDVASLLYQSRVCLDEQLRDELLAYYITKLALHVDVDRDDFVRKYHSIVLARTLQTLGAYGFRGLIQKKELFVQSIPKAIDVLRVILPKLPRPLDFPYLVEVLGNIIDNQKNHSLMAVPPKLKVSVSSFSYVRGIPVDTTGNGGGFVFDCRAIENPGRMEEYKRLTGKDKPVVDYLELLPETGEFARHVISLVSASVKRYQERGFSSLMVSFGCTGGRHRSVYFAERVSRCIAESFDVIVETQHKEQATW